MPNGSPHVKGQSAQVEEVCRRIFRHLLQQGESCRQNIAGEVPLSPASATNYTRWLSAKHYLTCRSVKGTRSKRPVEWMRLSGRKTTSIAVAVSSRMVAAELVAANGESLWGLERSLREPRQLPLMQALNHVVQACAERARQMGSRCGFAGISVSGTVGYGIIFSVDGIADWRPCIPTELLPAFEKIDDAEVWTRIQCKIEGFAHDSGRGGALGYFEWDGGRLRMATMGDGIVIEGRNGTVSSRLHQPVTRKGAVCYCGTTGCFVALLESGEANCDLVREVIGRLTREDGMEAAAVEWRAESTGFRSREGDGTELVQVKDPQAYLLAGLRLLCAEKSLIQAVREDRR